MTGRTFTCRRCGEDRVTDRLKGRLPTICDVCDPEAAERRRQDQQRTEERLATIEALQERVAVLERQLAAAVDVEAHDREFNEAADRRRHRLGEPGREAVGRAVRELAQTRGRSATRAALLDVCAACRAWARLLAITGEHDTDLQPTEPVQEAAAA